MSALASRHLYDAFVSLAAPIEIGPGPEGHRAIFPIADGTVKGERINGRFLPVGADWARIRPDGSIAVDVRATIRTDDDALILVTYVGRLVASPDILPAVLDVGRAEPVDPALYYFRTLVTFETASPAYAWLNAVCAVGVGHTGDGGVTYRVHEIV